MWHYRVVIYITVSFRSTIRLKRSFKSLDYKLKFLVSKKNQCNCETREISKKGKNWKRKRINIINKTEPRRWIYYFQCNVKLELVGVQLQVHSNRNKLTHQLSKLTRIIREIFFLEKRRRKSQVVNNLSQFFQLKRQLKSTKVGSQICLVLIIQ